jgi:hypothetical protein
VRVVPRLPTWLAAFEEIEVELDAGMNNCGSTPPEYAREDF